MKPVLSCSTASASQPSAACTVWTAARQPSAACSLDSCKSVQCSVQFGQLQVSPVCTVWTPASQPSVACTVWTAASQYSAACSLDSCKSAQCSQPSVQSLESCKSA